MDELFNTNAIKQPNISFAPLADRIRPKEINSFFGQSHLFGPDGPLRKFFDKRNFPSIIFWGPPGVGKTTLALMIAEFSSYKFNKLSAIDSGVKEVREVIRNAQMLQRSNQRTLLFIDEIHRFNKSQQDALLNAVEKGEIILIGATTENPSFEVNPALISRCRVYRLHPLSDEEIKLIIQNAIANDEILKSFEIVIEDWDYLLTIAGGDARTALNSLELAILYSGKADGELIITKALLENALQQRIAFYDKSGETHYDTISAFIKSLRGSDPDAALFWLAKMLDAGEDPKFIARRMVIFASEDIGNSDPSALNLAVSVFNAVNLIGMPECSINLAHGVTYLASCPKSNASYLALMKAQESIRNSRSQLVPLHLRNAPTKLMKQEAYARDYKYPHDFSGHFVEEHYFPSDVKQMTFYYPSEQGIEKRIKDRLELLWKNRYGKK